jgi:hypothetical protein
MTLELGDHVWYWQDNISTATNVPRAQWFPGSNPADPNDYQGHGVEIFNYVIHGDNTILRGQPHMRSGKGSFAWLDNNPGNITAPPDGTDYGQYAGKVNWHNFLVFPTYQTGFDAIATLLRGPGYANLSILAAFQRYAPAGDGGNNPTAYAQAVADAAGVDVSTSVGDLTDDQMQIMQNKIQEIEGTVEGDTLTWDSSDVPGVISSQLPQQ